MENSFDYVVVGGGTAGPIIASRLTENPHISVLLLEAGSENKKEAMFFANGVGQMWSEDTNWGYNTTPQKALKDRPIMQPRGKVMGGSASINVGSWSRGTAYNYDSWKLEDWDWETVSKWYLKIEDSDKGSGEYRGKNGPMKLEETPAGTFMTEVFRQASIEVGIGDTEDLNGEKNEGFDLWQCIFKNGRRHNTVANYLDTARTRPNLHIQTEAFVSKVILEEGVATAVEFFQQGDQKTVKANKEIILCAGTYNTPKILMLSGIGPEEHLSELGIPTEKNLPGVGANLSDHLRTDIGVSAPKGVGVSLRGNAQDADQMEEWRRTGYGPLAVAENTSAAFFKSSSEVPVADLELMFNINAPVQWGSPPPENAGWYINVGLVQPKSKGSLRLASADPKDAPLIDPNYLSDPQDLKAYIQGIKRALMYTQTKSLRAFTDLATLTIAPNASDEEIEDYIRSRAESIYHPAGTAKMGEESDPMAVVNPKLQVIGLKRLRIADASVIPELISGHTMAPTVLVAERLADFIKKESS
ncbi:MAG: GMC family oxidoreductase N-terminal domain-containing protein [Bacteroidota bacterium]